MILIMNVLPEDSSKDTNAANSKIEWYPRLMAVRTINDSNQDRFVRGND
jgi:hypothetical protein